MPPIFAGFTLAFALQLGKKHGRTSVRVVRHKHTMRIIVFFFFCRLSAKTQKMMMVIVTPMTQKLSKMRCWLSMQEKLSQIWARP